MECEVRELLRFVNKSLAAMAIADTSYRFQRCCSFPLDCVRAGVQGQDLIANSHRETAWSVLTELLHTRGIRGLYAGVAPSIVRAFLVSGSRFTAYEAALWLLRGGRDATAATV